MAKVWGKDYLNSTPGRDAWVPLRLLPDGSITSTASMVIDEGVATAGGTAISLIDATKGWEVNVLEGALIEMTVGGITYLRTIEDNLATILSFATIAPDTASAGTVYRIIKQVDPMTPSTKGVIHNTAYATANNFFASDLAGLMDPTLFRCQGVFSEAGVLSVSLIRGANTQIATFNHGVVLPAGALFEFDTLVPLSTTVNYQFSVDCTIQSFCVLEIPAAI